MAWNHALSRAVLRVYTRALGDLYRRDTCTRGIADGQTGMVTAVQRARCPYCLVDGARC